MLSRRCLLALAALAPVGVCGTAWAARSFEVKRLTAKGKHASRFDLLVPKHLGKDQKVRLLVALHGLGESHDPELGAAAWVDKYGLGSSYERLLVPPIKPIGKRGEWTDTRLAEVNVALKKKPFAGLAVACPFTPNFKNAADRAKAIREYGDWIVEQVVPAARKEAPCPTGPAWTSLDGCSMGGPFALDIFIAHADVFGAVGTVQGAFGENRAPKYAEQLDKAMSAAGSARPVHLLSSEGDKFRGSAKALGAELDKRKLPNTVRIIPGPHDQPWLREAGTIEMLMFHDRR